MKTLDFYIDKAREKTGASSDLQLATKLNLKTSAISYWRTGKSFPSDDTMIKLAALADISREQALLELSYWRADGEAKETFKKLISRLGVTAAAIGLIIFSNPSNVLASEMATTTHENALRKEIAFIYYGKYKRFLYRITQQIQYAYYGFLNLLHVNLCSKRTFECVTR